MDLNCQHIKSVLKLAEDNGNVIVDVSRWTKIEKVIYMRDKISIAFRKKIQSEFKQLEYWKVEKTPQDPANEGFVCYECSVAIVFPL